MLFDPHIEAVNKAINKQCKILQRKLGKKPMQRFVAEQEKLVINLFMPPLVGSPTGTFDKSSMLAMCSVEREFNDKEVDEALSYIERDVYEVIRHPNVSEHDLNVAFIRISVAAYMMEALMDVMYERGALIMTPTFVAKAKSHTAALMNFLTTIQERKIRTGKLGLSGSNFAEVDEFFAMWQGMIQATYVSEWYCAYNLIMRRFVLNRIGGSVDDWRKQS